MGVIQSGLNQSLALGAAIYTQTPTYKNKAEQNLKKRELEKAQKKAEAAKGVAETPGLTEQQKEFAAKQAESAGKAVYELDPTAQNLQNIQFAPTKTISQSSAVGEKQEISNSRFQNYHIQELLMQRRVDAIKREQANKIAQMKALEQSKQMAEIKQHAKYSEEDDFYNPYVGW